MKKFILFITMCLMAFPVKADEGMWFLMFIERLNHRDMQKMGLQLTAEEIYSINNHSLKDAIVQFNGGCTAEIVSKEGLVLTNHHCGYDAIAELSSAEKNYLKDGYWAPNRKAELKPSSLYVRFFVRMDDVTKRILAKVNDQMTEEERGKAIQQEMAVIEKENNEGGKYTVSVRPFFQGNEYYYFVYQDFKDMRLVGAPPESVGKFGGDTDNWEWPRHTGDFSVFRVYADKNGNPADYSKENTPLKPRYFLPVSIKGIKDGDFAMIFGYPGGTNRYETSYGIKLKTDIENPSLVALRDLRLKYMHEQMIKDPAVKLKLASSYAGIANYWKFFDGETKQLQKFNTYGSKQEFENKFNAWAKGKPEFENIMSEYEKNYVAWTPYAKHRQYLREGILGSPLAAFASSLMGLEAAMVKTGATGADIKKAADAADKQRIAFLEGEDKPSDVKILAAVAKAFYTDIDKSQQPIGFYEKLKAAYGDLNEEATYKKWAEDVFANTIIFNDAKWSAFIANPDANALQADPAFDFAASFIKNYNNKYSQLYPSFLNRNNDLGHSYMKGIMQMNPAAVNKMYPDANFSMRVSYGNVKSYKPRDAVFYDYVTTSKGVLEKYKPGDYEYDLPVKQIELLKKRDF